jgi:hypothetical protein
MFLQQNSWHPYRAAGNLPTKGPQSVICVGSGQVAIGICVVDDDASCVTQSPSCPPSAPDRLSILPPS